MILTIEHTDTFAGEANYCWVRRDTLTLPDDSSRRTIMRRVKAWAGLTGDRCRVDDFGDTLAIWPAGVCHVVFVTFGGQQ